MLDTNFVERRKGEVRRIQLRRPGLGVSKRPITPVRPVRIAINRLDTLQKLTGTPRVTMQTLPVITNGNISLTMTRRLKGVIRYTPVRNEA